VATDEKEEYLSIDEALVELEQVEEEREEVDEELTDIIRNWDLEDIRAESHEYAGDISRI
jgi:hypothetical protein